MNKYELKKNEIPEGGIAHTVPGLGKITISEELSDEVIERLPENLRDLYFKKKA